MPRRPCIEPNCPGFATYRGRCEDHAREREVETHARPRARRADPATARIYGTKKWRLLRRRVLKEEPICKECGAELSTEVDHVVAIEDGGHPFRRSNLQGLCTPCHGRKTAGEVRSRSYA